MIARIPDIIMYRPPLNPDDFLHEALIKQLVVSEKKHIQHVLLGVRVGDMPPVSLYGEYKRWLIPFSWTTPPPVAYEFSACQRTRKAYRLRPDIGKPKDSVLEPQRALWSKRRLSP